MQFEQFAELPLGSVVWKIWTFDAKTQGLYTWNLREFGKMYRLLNGITSELANAVGSKPGSY